MGKLEFSKRFFEVLYGARVKRDIVKSGALEFRNLAN